MIKGRVETIDALRGIAILKVVMFHFTTCLPAYALNISEGAPLPVFFGWVGVYFFIIISGYCIFMTLERSSTVGVFLARRFSRICPAFAAVLLALRLWSHELHSKRAGGQVPCRTAKPGRGGDEPALRRRDRRMGRWRLLVHRRRGQFRPPHRHHGRDFRAARAPPRAFAWLAVVMAPIWAVSTLFFPVGSGSVTPQSMLKSLATAPCLAFVAVGVPGCRIQTGAEGLTGLLAANVLLSIAVAWLEAFSFENHGAP